VNELPVEYHGKTLPEIFDYVFENNSWNGTESRSGGGSTYDITETLRRSLRTVICMHDVRSVIDVGCGDYNWMRHVAYDLQYLGVDISPKVVEYCESRYGDATHKFISCDITTDRLTIPKVDMVLVRDCMVHLKNEDAYAILETVLSWGPKLLALTHFPVKENGDTPGLLWRPLNMMKPPFNLREPDLMLVDQPDKYKALGIWMAGN
jgi:SAM-dependent methyltransferase